MHTIIEYFFRCLNLYTLCLTIGYVVGFATAYATILWPVRKTQNSKLKTKD